MERREVNALRTGVRRKALNRYRAFRRSAPLTFVRELPLVSEGMEITGAPRALREQGRRSFGSFIQRLFDM